ncbi:transcriptional regulator of GntR family domain [Bosea sp. BIWAKO-01]|nr:transcriptional regulator of GntR family domain [Bosea sp. BIWAKO-01]
MRQAEANMWIPELDPSRPVYRAIAEAIAQDMVRGRLATGDKLPPQRDLARALGLNLSSVTKAYKLAFELGLVNGEIGRGTYVRAGDASRIPWPSGENQISIDFASNFPMPLDPSEDVVQLCQDMARYDVGERLFEYVARGAANDDISPAALWLEGLGVPTRLDGILLTSGAINGVFACLLALAKAGETVLCEELTSPGLVSCARMMGLKLVGVPMDRDGMKIDAFERIATETGARVAVLNPTLNNPTLTDLSPDRRERLAAFALRSGIMIVEDEVYAPLLGTPPKPLAALAPDAVCYVTSFSKAVLPGLRIGYISAPPLIAERLRNAIRVSTWMPSPMLARLASRWVRDDTATRLIAKRRAAGRERIDLARRVLRRHALASRDDGLHVWLSLPQPWRGDEFATYARARGLTVMPSQDLAANSTSSIQALRLSLGAEPSLERLEQGLSRIDLILRGRE